MNALLTAVCFVDSVDTVGVTVTDIGRRKTPTTVTSQPVQRTFYTSTNVIGLYQFHSLCMRPIHVPYKQRMYWQFLTQLRTCGCRSNTTDPFQATSYRQFDAKVSRYQCQSVFGHSCLGYDLLSVLNNVWQYRFRFCWSFCVSAEFLQNVGKKFSLDLWVGMLRPWERQTINRMFHTAQPIAATCRCDRCCEQWRLSLTV